MSTMLSGECFSQESLWDNEIGPPWGKPAGRAVSPPAAPHLRVVDDFFALRSGWIITEFVATVLEDETWESSGTSTVYIYRDVGDRPGDGDLFTDQLGPLDREDTGFNRTGRRVYYHTIHVAMLVPQGQWWIGLRDGKAGGEGTAGWTTSPPADYKGSTGYFSLDFGDTWGPEGREWHHAFEVRGFVIGEETPGYVREIEPVHFSGEPVGGVEEIRESDDEYYELTADSFSRVSRAHLASVIFKTTLPVFPLQRLGLRVESTTTHTTVRQELAIFDFDAERWIVVDDRPLRTDGDMIVSVESFERPDRFINDDDGQVQVRLNAYSPGTTLTRHTVKIDQLNLLVTYAPM
jgi:hypothetical protein